jgi:hypothetical protein
MSLVATLAGAAREPGPKLIEVRLWRPRI